MDDTAIIGLSRQVALTRALEVTANNIANQNTAGFKAETPIFEEFLVRSIGASPRGVDVTSLVFDRDTTTDFSVGTVSRTLAPFDFAIEGPGFFAIETPAGVRYTRDGHFSINPFGDLVTRDGHPVLDDGLSPILIDRENGEITVSPEGDLNQGTTFLGRIGIFDFSVPEALQQIGGNQFATSEPPQPVLRPLLQQGFIENSNVAAIEGMTHLIQISRAYTQAAQLVETANELSRQAVQSFTNVNQA